MDARGEEQIIRTEYAELMQKSYIDYAMSVIVSRALPDVRDGLKPVQRRTLYDMYELGIRYDRPYRKAARIVGDTMGKYHPHGDSSIYGALVVMAQDFKMGMPLVDGHGNFGSIEGDGAAAMRYTEARLNKVTQETFLEDLDKGVVEFVPNFDETETEPEVLPARVPNLLINGAEGIAVGMATSIPPHNFSEVIDGVIAYMKDPDINTEQMMRYIPGPDFPTGGIVANKDDLLAIYSTGTGKIKLRGKVEIERGKGGKDRLVITEIPYTMIGANIGKFLNDVYALVESKKTSDIVDITNQSSKEGIRIVIELRKGADAENLKNLLYKKTKLEDTFGVNMLAVVDGRPETMGIVPIIRHHVDFQYEIATKKYTALLEKEREKREVQEGLIRACDVIDVIIEVLRGSKSVKEARACLIEGKTEGIRFRTKQAQKDAAALRFTERQADAILEMRLYRLIGLEIEALQKEHEKTLSNIERYEEILGSRAAMARVIIRELQSWKREYGRERRTEIANLREAVVEEKKPEEMDVVFLMDRFGYAKTVDVGTFERNREAAESESRCVITCRNTDKICIFTNKGQMHLLKVMDLPFGRFRDKGTPIDNLSNYDSSEESFVHIESLSAISGGRLIFGTRAGMLKIVSGAEFDVSKRTTAATKLSDGDELLFVQPLGEAAQGGEAQSAVPQEGAVHSTVPQSGAMPRTAPQGGAVLGVGAGANSASDGQGVLDFGGSGAGVDAGVGAGDGASRVFGDQEVLDFGGSGASGTHGRSAEAAPEGAGDGHRAAAVTRQGGSTGGAETLAMWSKKNYFLRISVSDIPEKKKGALGVRGMRLGDGDEVCGMRLLREGEQETIEANGKEVALHRLRVASRDTRGTKK